MSETETRLARIEVRIAIEDGMQAYAAAADAKYTASRQKRTPDVITAAARAQAAIFAPDAVWSGGAFGGDLVGRDAIAGFFETSPWHFTAHLYGGARIALSADLTTATAAWKLIELGIGARDGRVLLLSGQVAQNWRNTSEGWRISRMGFDQLHAVELAAQPQALRCLIPLAEGIQ